MKKFGPFFNDNGEYLPKSQTRNKPLNNKWVEKTPQQSQNTGDLVIDSGRKGKGQSDFHKNGLHNDADHRVDDNRAQEKEGR